MGKKILTQTGMVVLIALALFISKNSHVGVLEQGADTVLSYMEVSYTAEDAKKAVEKSKAAAASVTSTVNDAVEAIAGKPTYGDPIDEDYTGNKAAVYAVGGGDVTAVGENEEIGKYIRITHGDSGESLYGNLASVNVVSPSKVKKGQIIGIYEKQEGRDFYYSFRKFK